MNQLNQKNFVNGTWIDASSGAQFAVTNPANQNVIAHVPSVTREDVHSAIYAASAAFKEWQALSHRRRSDYLLAISQALLSKSDQVAQIITSEQGKPLFEARAEVIYAANYLRWFSEEAVRINGDVIPADSQGNHAMILKQPIGVVAAITPWNFPLAMLARKLGAALAAGCTVIAKPAPETPLSALALADIVDQSGLPAGVINVITGDAEMIAAELMKSPIVRKITFTGSTEVGKLLIKGSAETVKRLTLELGGDAPFIVFDDCDLERAIDGAMHAKYRNAGQTCICINRFLVHEKIADEFTNRLIARSRELVVGDGMDPTTQVGPLISDEAVTKVARLIQAAQSEGAQIALAPQQRCAGSRFISPTVITSVTPQMSIWNEEIFGPVCAITTFSSEEEAITLANNTPYGLAAYLYTQDLSRALRITKSLDYGMIGVNESTISSVQAPFGGVKESGFGREGSKYGVDEYLVLKYVVVGA